MYNMVKTKDLYLYLFFCQIARLNLKFNSCRLIYKKQDKQEYMEQDKSCWINHWQEHQRYQIASICLLVTRYSIPKTLKSLYTGILHCMTISNSYLKFFNLLNHNTNMIIHILKENILLFKLLLQNDYVIIILQ